MIATLALVLVLMFWAVSLARRPRRVLLGPRLLWLPALGLLACAWLCTASAVDPALGPEANADFYTGPAQGSEADPAS